MELQFLLFSCKRNRLLDFLTSIFSLFADCAAPSNKSSTSDDQGNSNQINPDELKKRTEFLKAQRDKLLAMKRAEREKQLEVRSHHIFFTNSEFSICNFVIKNNGYIGILYSYIQGMSCEGACAHAHVGCEVARVRVRAKSILKSVRDVRACGFLWACDVRPHFCTLFGTKLTEIGIFFS